MQHRVRTSHKEMDIPRDQRRVLIDKSWTKVKGTFNPTIRKPYLPKTRKLRFEKSKIDYERQLQHEFMKRDAQNKKKQELEMRNCTFNPEFNAKSIKNASGPSRVQIQKRDVPDRYKREVIEAKQSQKLQEEAELELQTLRIPDNSGKKYSETFYQEKFDWKQKVVAKLENMKEEEIKALGSTLKGQPDLAMTKGSKIVNPEAIDNSPFLERVPKYIEKRNEKLARTEGKMYAFSYKPTLHRPERKGEAVNA